MAYLGLALIASAIPLVVPLGSLAAVVIVAGALSLIYAWLPSGYPMLGVLASVALASGAFAIIGWLFD